MVASPGAEPQEYRLSLVDPHLPGRVVDLTTREQWLLGKSLHARRKEDEPVPELDIQDRHVFAEDLLNALVDHLPLFRVWLSEAIFEQLIHLRV